MKLLPKHLGRTLAFLMGLAILVHDVFLTELDRPYTLVLALFLLGIPVTKYLDALRALGKGDDDK